MLKQTLFHPAFDRIIQSLPADVDIYLVGGAIRDALLQRPTHDLDFVMRENSIPIARRLADTLKTPFYIMDEIRETARVIYTQPRKGSLVIDFSKFRGEDLLSDLRARDFTINAMAVNVREPEKLIDPADGAYDLNKKILRTPLPDSIQEDPIRALRAIRLSVELDLTIQTDTKSQIRTFAPGLKRISAERKRDEIFRILNGSKVSTAFRVLEILGVLNFIFPRMAPLFAKPLEPGQIRELWERTLTVQKSLEDILGVIGSKHDPDKAADLISGLTVMSLGGYRKKIAGLLESELTPDRSIRGLLFLTAFFSFRDPTWRTTWGVDVRGKDTCVWDQSTLRLPEIRRTKEDLMTDLALSNREVRWVVNILRNQLRPISLNNQTGPISHREIYHFFRDTGDAGIPVCLLSLALVRSEYGVKIHQGEWETYLITVHTLMEAWWEHKNEIVSPPLLVNGNEIGTRLNLQHGPMIGELLEAIREAQVGGELTTKEDALIFAEEFIRTR